MVFRCGVSEAGKAAQNGKGLAGETPDHRPAQNPHAPARRLPHGGASSGLRVRLHFPMKPIILRVAASVETAETITGLAALRGPAPLRRLEARFSCFVLAVKFVIQRRIKRSRRGSCSSPLRLCHRHRTRSGMSSFCSSLRLCLRDRTRSGLLISR